MIQTIIIPTLKRKEYPEVMKLSYKSMGLLSINYFNNYKNYLKLFFDNLEKNKHEFREFDMVSIFVIFDNILQNNISNNSLGSDIM
jgi:hypothetical protein